jgi:hypothetical protein
MGTLLIDDPVQTDDLLSFDRISSGWATGTAWDESLTFSPTTSLYRSAQQAATGANATVPDDPVLGLERIANNQPPPLLTPEQADEQYGIEGELTFSSGDYAKGVREEEAKLLRKWKEEEIARRDILARATPGFVPGAARFAAGMAATVVDPINLASAFIPVLGEARFAALAGKVGLTGARVARGALEGAVGAVAVEPIILLQARSEQADYDMYDSLLNVTFGTLVGAGLHAGGGAVKDLIVGRPDLTPEVAPVIPAEVHDTALRGAVAAVAEDRPVEVADLVRASVRRDKLMSDTTLSRKPEVRIDPDITPGAIVNPAEQAAAARVEAVEARAREIDPETFAAYDRLTKERETYNRWVSELSGTRQQNADALVADLDRQIAETKAKLDNAPNQRKAKTYQKRLDELTAERDQRVTEAVSRDSPDMAKVRAKVLETDIAMRDLAPKVSAAKRQAEAEQPVDVPAASEVTDPLDRRYDPIIADAPTFERAWEATRQQQRASSFVRQSDTAALSQVDQKAKDYAKPATIETESKALEEWAAADNELVESQRQAGNLDETDEALLKEGAVTEKQHLDRAKGLEALAQCLL